MCLGIISRFDVAILQSPDTLLTLNWYLLLTLKSTDILYIDGKCFNYSLEKYWVSRVSDGIAKLPLIDIVLLLKSIILTYLDNKIFNLSVILIL